MNIKDYNFQGKKAFVRVDFNVPLENGKITDDTPYKRCATNIEKDSQRRRTVNNSLAPRTSRKESRREVFAAADTRRRLETFGYRG